MTTVYGIKNCDTMKKALRWLDEHGHDYHFHDYKKDGVPPDVIKAAIAAHGWETVINRRGTSWRALPDAAKEAMNDKNALKAAQDNPSLVKRPLLAHKGKTYIGFTPDDYQAIL